MLICRCQIKQTSQDWSDYDFVFSADGCPLNRLKSIVFANHFCKFLESSRCKSNTGLLFLDTVMSTVSKVADMSSNRDVDIILNLMNERHLLETRNSVVASFIIGENKYHAEYNNSQSQMSSFWFSLHWGLGGRGEEVFELYFNFLAHNKKRINSKRFIFILF